MSILIGSERGDFVELSVSGWAIDDPENSIDAGWLATDIAIVAGPLSGHFPTQLRVLAHPVRGREARELPSLRHRGKDSDDGIRPALRNLPIVSSMLSVRSDQVENRRLESVPTSRSVRTGQQ